jgi:hypothetical protein
MKQYTIEEIEQHIEPLEIALRGWEQNETVFSPDPEKFTEEKGETTVLGIIQELKFWECHKALINHEFMSDFPLTKDQCLEFISSFSAMKKELITDKQNSPSK